MTRPLKGWNLCHGGPERYRYPCGNGRMLMVVGMSARKWFYAECADVRHTRWVPAGMETSMHKAMHAALDLLRCLEQAQDPGPSDGNHST